MIQFTRDDMVVVDGKPCLVRHVEGDAVQVLTMHGEYVTVSMTDIQSVYID